MSFNKLRNTFDYKLSSIDKFEEPVQLNLKGENASTSALGGFISLLVMLFLGYQALIQSIDMIRRDSRQVVQMNEFQNDPSGFFMNQASNSNFFFSSMLGNNLVNITQNSALNLNAYYYQIISNDDGSKNTSVSKLLFSPCDRSDFPLGVYKENIFDKYSLDYAYCLKAINYTNMITGICPPDILKDYPDCISPPNFKLQGSVFSSTYEFVGLQFKLCYSNDTTSLHGLNCSSDSENDVLTARGISVYLGFSNTYIDPANYSSPNQTFLDFIDWDLHPQSSSSADIYVDTETVQDYDNFLFGNIHHDRTFFSISADKMREYQQPSQGYLLETYFQRSKLNRITTRIFVKIFDVMSNVGGLSEPLFLIGSIFALGYARYKYFMTMSNELYDFEVPKQIISLKKIGLANLPVPASARRNSNMQSPGKLFIQRKSQKGKINMKDYFDSLRVKKKIEYNIFSFMTGVWRNLLNKKTLNEQLAERAKKKNYKRSRC